MRKVRRYRGRTIVLKRSFPAAIALYIVFCVLLGACFNMTVSLANFKISFSDNTVDYMLGSNIASMGAAYDKGESPLFSLYLRYACKIILGFDYKVARSMLTDRLAALDAYNNEIQPAFSIIGLTVPYSRYNAGGNGIAGQNGSGDMLALKDVNTWKSGNETASGLYMRNESKYNPNLEEYLAAPLPIELDDKGPQVLVISSHATEAFAEDGNNYYPKGVDERSLDINKNVVRVGAEVAKVLNAKGLETLHDTSLNDSPSYTGSYTRTLEVIEWYLEKYPSIKMVLDIHRDSMVQGDGTKLRPVAEINGKRISQIMLVIGTDQGGLYHPNWKNNLNFGVKIQNQLNKMYTKIARPINLRVERFNQHTTFGSIIAEMGSSGNTLEESVRAGECLGNAVAAVFGK